MLMMIGRRALLKALAAMAAMGGGVSGVTVTKHVEAEREGWRKNLVTQLERHEGWKPYAYQDHLGWWTIGYGRLIDKRRGGEITLEEGEYLLNNDIDKRLALLRQRITFFDRLPPTVKQALVNMSFQLGVHGLLNFRRMLRSLEVGDWQGARLEALDSVWARTQTKGRAEEVSSMFLPENWEKTYG